VLYKYFNKKFLILFNGYLTKKKAIKIIKNKLIDTFNKKFLILFNGYLTKKKAIKIIKIN